MDGLARSLWPKRRDQARVEVTGQQMSVQDINASLVALRATQKGQVRSLCTGSCDRDVGLAGGSCGGLGRRADLGSGATAAPSWPGTTLPSLTQETVK